MARNEMNREANWCFCSLWLANYVKIPIIIFESWWYEETKALMFILFWYYNNTCLPVVGIFVEQCNGGISGNSARKLLVSYLYLLFRCMALVGPEQKRLRTVAIIVIFAVQHTIISIRNLSPLQARVFFKLFWKKVRFHLLRWTLRSIKPACASDVIRTLW